MLVKSMSANKISEKGDGQVPTKWLPKSCPRCKGDLFTDGYTDDGKLACLQCSRAFAGPKRREQVSQDPAKSARIEGGEVGWPLELKSQGGTHDSAAAILAAAEHMNL